MRYGLSDEWQLTEIKWTENEAVWVLGSKHKRILSASAKQVYNENEYKLRVQLSTFQVHSITNQIYVNALEKYSVSVSKYLFWSQ